MITCRSSTYVERSFFYIDTKHKQMHDEYCDELISKSNAQLHTHNATLTTSKSKCQDNIIILKQRWLWRCVIFGMVLCLSYSYWCAITDHLCSFIHDWSFKISNVHQIIQEIAHKISSFLYPFPFDVAMRAESGSHVSCVHQWQPLSQSHNVMCHLFTNENRYSLTITQPWRTPLPRLFLRPSQKGSGQGNILARSNFDSNARNKGCGKRP